MQETPLFFSRYERQTILPQVGVQGQHALQGSRVLVAGAGGLGCPVLQYLAAAGVGTIGIADYDVVSLHNLHRQVLYSTADVGLPKAATAAQKLEALNPHNKYRVFAERINEKNITQLITDYDVVVDGTDNFTTRYLINDACMLAGKPLVFGAINRFEGQVAVFGLPGVSGEIIHYRDLFPHPPQAGEVANCAESGVLGVLPGIVGSLMANEVLKLLLGIGQPLCSQLLTYNALTNELMQWQLKKHPQSDALLPPDTAALRQKNYDYECGVSPTLQLLTRQEVWELIGKPDTQLIDVREPHETPHLQAIPHQRIPLGTLMQHGLQTVPPVVVLVCQSGKRSLQAAQWLKQQYPACKAHSVAGGIYTLL